MSFNYGKEKLLFDLQWAKKEKEMIAVGMSKEEIEQIYQFDWDWFKSERRFRTHTKEIDDITIISQGSEQEFEESFSVFDLLEDERLIKGIRKLSTEEKELLYEVVVEEQKQVTYAKNKGLSTRMVHYKLEMLKRKLTK